MHASGFAPEDFAAQDQTVHVWPENWPVWLLFCRASTQWRTGATGACIGLDYSSVFALLDRQFTDPADWQAAFDDLQHIERAALRAMREDQT